MKRKQSISQLVLYIFMLCICVIWLIPLLLLVSASFTDADTLYSAGYSIIPKTFSLESYQYIIQMGGSLAHAYLVSAFVTVFGTVLSLTLTALTAYPLSNRNFRARNIFSFLVFFTMLFNGGTGT